MRRALISGTWFILSAIATSGYLLACSSSPSSELPTGDAGAGNITPSAGGGGGKAPGSSGSGTSGGPQINMSGGSSGTGNAQCDGGDCKYIVPDAGPYCGDGIKSLEVGELCDDGNRLGGDGCSANCKREEPNFLCETPGQPCVSLVVCGNGVRDVGESCDDGNKTEGDGCNATCKVESGYRCIVAGQPCQLLQDCGNGVRSEGEGCDDGNKNDGDGCSAGCVVEEGYRCRGLLCEQIPVCGDGIIAAGKEECDDANAAPSDGCSPLCKIEASYYDCSVPGALCVDSSMCGNGKLEKTELCDDGGLVPGDGCSEVCAVEPGYQCRAAGKPCVSLCGDGTIIGDEQCDDLNAVSGDGCSSTCLVEPGYDCSTKTCIASVCGNGVIEKGESCDNGAEKNGLFYGDLNGDGVMDGCSKSCTVEPNCRPAGVTQACTTACGDGNHDEGEECDDGNQVDGDGCSSVCVAEAGFTCVDQEMPDTTPCPTNKSLECLMLPVIYRDFEGQNVGGGHPDFFYLGGSTICVPNAAGVPADVDGNCSSTDATGPCEGLVKPTLNALGKPELAGASGECPCRFTDWNNTSILNASTAGVEQCTVEGDGSTRYRVGYDTPLMVTVIQSADTFKQWYTTDPAVNTEVLGSLALEPLAAGQYQFSSSDGKTVYDDLHAVCVAADLTGDLESGFFPLEDQPATKVCNIWPYWASGLEDAGSCCAGSSCPVTSEWDPSAVSYDGCPSSKKGTGSPVPKSDGSGGQVNGMMRNFYFTTEVRYLFRYSGTSTSLAFYGDDDVWVFINGQLALDLGAPHERMEGTVAVNDSWGLEAGKVYEIAVFHADQHPRESNYQLTLSGFSTNRSVCTPRCGDMNITAGEECDNGEANADGVYDGCTTECKLGPFCGDGVPNGAEQCDDGFNTTVAANVGGCGPGCILPPSCGNGSIEAAEECDNGTANADGLYGGCSADCRLNPYCGDGQTDSPTEECDDGVNVGGYGYCDVGCVNGPRCGDGIKQEEGGELCDEGAANGTPESSCTADCGVAGYCGDYITQPELGEECDLGNNTGEYNGCMPDCLNGPRCGDGVLQAESGEECDYGPDNSPPDSATYGGCLISCELGPHCGDKTVQSPDEQCDDGNNEDQDGCSGACMIEIELPK